MGVTVGDGVGVICEQLQLAEAELAPEPVKLKVSFWQGILLIAIDTGEPVSVPFCGENERLNPLVSLACQFTVADWSSLKVTWQLYVPSPLAEQFD